MNHIYRLVWNDRQQAYVAATENARSRGKSSSVVGTALASVVLALAGHAGTASATQAANTLPTGGQVSAGMATISTSANTLTVGQSSQRAAINWNSFSVGSNASVNFNQPSASAITLNRVVGNESSVIDGAINANGNVWILNSSGILFNRNAQVNVGGLVASTLGMNDASFMAGSTAFEGNGSSGSILNLGTLQAANAGHIALLGQHVANEGVITATLGSAVLAAGDKVTLNFNGNSLVGVTIDRGVLNALVENKNAIVADGGQVILTAKGLDGVMSTVVNNTGEIQAQTIQNQEGKILLLGGMQSDSIVVAGTLDASAPNGGNGGYIETSAAHVTIADSARVTTSAPGGQSGTWLIDPADFTIAASGGDISGATLSSNLGSGNVTIQSTSGAVNTSGNGDIFVNDNVTWTSGNSLTLNAQRNIHIDATIDASGGSGGVVNLYYGQGAIASGNTASYNFGLTASGFAGKINLQAGQNFNTKLGSDGTVTNWTAITQLGSQGDETANPGNSLQGLDNTANLNGNFVLGADIDAGATASWNSGLGFTPIGHYNPLGGAWEQQGYAFGGQFDGLGHTISNLQIAKPATYNSGNFFAGLFGITLNANISNLNIASAQISAFNAAGILVGDSASTNINNVHVEGTVTGHNELGGMIGELSFTTIANSSANVTVSSTGDTAGGLVGYGDDSTFVNVSSSGSVHSLLGTVGGLIGDADGNIAITNSHSSAAVSSDVNSTYTGGLVGLMEANVSISTSYATGSVAGYDYVGGLLGSSYSYDTTHNSLTTSYSTGVVTGDFYVGGLVGNAQYLTVAQSYHTTGAVSGASAVGGLVGEAPGDVQISHSYATVTVSSTEGAVGGLVGQALNTAANRSISDSYATGDVSSPGTSIGGLVGEGYINITRSYATGAVQGGGYVGGLIGAAYNDSSEVIQQSFATGSVTSTGSRVGGLAGYSEITFNDVYATGTATGASKVGGLVGQLASGSNVTNAYSFSTAIGSSSVGGLIGTSAGTVTNSYWDVLTSGIGASGQSAGSAGGIGKSTFEMKDLQTFSGQINWSIVSDAALSNVYPQLRWATNGISAGSSIWVIGTAVAPNPATPPSSGSSSAATNNQVAYVNDTAVLPQGLSDQPLNLGDGSADHLLPASYVVNEPGALTPLRTPGVMPSNVAVVPPDVNLSFGPSAELALISVPDGEEPANSVTLTQARAMTARQSSGGVSGGDREVRVPVSRNSLAQIVNGGVRLPGGVEQQLFVVQK